jgi:4-hydroxyphenylacetate 3-monooxygenase
VDRYLRQYVRGSNGIDYKQRIKIMKLLWDAIGTEFGGRHELYERNYVGNHEMIRMQALFHARGSGSLAEMEALADQCMSEYDETGWADPGYSSGEDISVLDKVCADAQSSDGDRDERPSDAFDLPRSVRPHR